MKPTGGSSQEAARTDNGSEYKPRSSAGTERLVSLDALRGFDMFWIIGADALVSAMRNTPAIRETPVVKFLAHQLEHVPWEGMVFYDLIFPLFVFMAGSSIPLAFRRRREQGQTTGQIFQHLLIRSVVLYLLGVLYYGGLSNYTEEIRWVGVLQRIAISYFFAGVLYLFFRPRWLVLWLAGILLAYWALMAWVPFPSYPSGEIVRGVFTETDNLAAHVDRQFLPGKAWFSASGDRDLGGWDPEGLLSSIPAVGSCLIGVLAGSLLIDPRGKPWMKSLILLGCGAALVGVGYGWGYAFPIIKNIWTSSYVCMAGGYSLLLLGLFYQVIDVWRFRAWAIPCVWIGTNAIFIYMSDKLVNWSFLVEGLTGGHIADVLGDWTTFTHRLLELALKIGLLAWMYNRRIFIRV